MTPGALSALSPLLPTFAQALLKQVGDPTPYVALLSLKGLDVLVGLTQAVRNRQLDPSRLKDAPIDALIIVVLVAMALALNAVSPIFAPVLAAVVAFFAASEGASILKNVALCYAAFGKQPPPAIQKLATLIEGIEDSTFQVPALAPAAPVAPDAPAPGGENTATGPAGPDAPDANQGG